MIYDNKTLYEEKNPEFSHDDNDTYWFCLPLTNFDHEDLKMS